MKQEFQFSSLEVLADEAVLGAVEYHVLIDRDLGYICLSFRPHRAQCLKMGMGSVLLSPRFLTNIEQDGYAIK